MKHCEKVVPQISSKVGSLRGAETILENVSKKGGRGAKASVGQALWWRRALCLSGAVHWAKKGERERGCGAKWGSGSWPGKCFINF